jgi:cytidine deaminase
VEETDWWDAEMKTHERGTHASWIAAARPHHVYPAVEMNLIPLTFDELYQKAKSVINPRQLSEDAEAGGVGAAILTESGNVYTGVCIDTASSMGFCAEHAAAAAMVTAGESRVSRMIAVGWDGRIMPPCGRCREFISQLHNDNLDAEVMVGEGVVVTIRELLPYRRSSADTRS